MKLQLSCGMARESSRLRRFNGNSELENQAAGMKIAIQGEPGSFSHEAAIKLIAAAATSFPILFPPMLFPPL